MAMLEVKNLEVYYGVIQAIKGIQHISGAVSTSIPNTCYCSLLPVLLFTP